MAETLSVQQLGAIFKRFCIAIIVAVLVGGIGGYGIAKTRTPTFAATATQLVKGLPGAQAAANYQAAQYAISRAKSYPAFIHSTRVLESVNADLGGKEDINRLALDLSAENPVDTPLIEVTALGSTPQQARDKANSAARHLASFIAQIETVAGTSPVSVETAVQAVLPAKPVAPRPYLIAALAALLLGSATFAAAIAIAQSGFRVRRKVRKPGELRASWWDMESDQQGAGATPPTEAGTVDVLDHRRRDERPSAATRA